MVMMIMVMMVIMTRVMLTGQRKIIRSILLLLVLSFVVSSPTRP